MKNSLFTTAAFAAVVCSAQAQVEVVDSAPQDGQPAHSRSASNGGGGADNPQAQMYYQLQALQQEVMELRGLVEEQAYEIKKLKKKRMDDYLDLDRRISALSSGEVAMSDRPDEGNVSSASQSSNAAAPATAGTDAQGEEALYNDAYDLLYERKVDESLEAFKQHLERYPNGQYAPNSYYWLGEIYLLKNDLPTAQQWFSDLLNQFPDSRKVPDAQFKLGKVYHMQGQNARARELLNKVAGTDADAARLAEQYLKENF